MTSDKAIALDWSGYADSVLRCSVDGLRFGRKLGRNIGQSKRLEILHLIGHSCGAFVVLGVCQGVKSGAGKRVLVQTTYLDPVSVYGGIFHDYGREHFGSCADYSEVYFDRGDAVPGSNTPLPNALNHDVSAERKTAEYAGKPHLWPIEYYFRKIRRADLLRVGHSANEE